jgi:Tfp pilus assembly PilM family ATPase/Tfp pilus assembly protein PilN
MSLRGLSTVIGFGERLASSIFNTKFDPLSTGIIFSGAGIDVIGLTESSGKTKVDNFFQLDTNGNNPMGAETARMLSLACAENGIDGRKVSNIVGTNEYSLRYVDLPEMPVDEIIDSLRFSERESFPFPLENAAIDASIINNGSQSSRLKILMAALDSVSVDKYRTFFKHTNLKHSAISTIPSALTALIGKSNSLNNEKSVTFLTFDNTQTGLYIFRNGEPEFMRHIPFGLRNVAYPQPGDLPERSDEIKVESGAPNDDAPPHRYINADRSDFWGYVQETGQAEPNFERLVFELKRSLEYYKNEFGRGGIEKLLCVSASPRIEPNGVASLSNALSENLNIPVEPYNPFDDFLTVEDESLAYLKDLGSSLAIQAGIAIDRGEGLNLLPHRDRYSLMRKTLRRLPQIALVVYFLFVISFAVIGRWYAGDLNRQIVNIEKGIVGKNIRTTSVTEKIKSEIDTYKIKIDEIDSRLNKYPPLLGNDISWVNMFRGLSKTIPADIALDSAKIRFNSNSFMKNNKRETGNFLELEGSVKGSPSRQLLTLREFINGLKQSDQFKNTSLASSNRVSSKNNGSRILKFRITATVNGL